MCTCDFAKSAVPSINRLENQKKQYWLVAKSYWEVQNNWLVYWLVLKKSWTFIFVRLHKTCFCIQKQLLRHGFKNVLKCYV